MFVETLTGNFGVAVPDGSGNINIVSENTTALFRGSGNTLTQNFLDPFNNIGLGDALVNITTGIQNTSVGYLTLTSATSVNDVTAVGFNAGANLQTGGNFAVAVGADAMSRCVSSGEYNVGIGARALDLLSGSGAHNIGIGGFALLGGNSNISGSDNIAIGYTAGQFITTGISNIAIGTQAIFSNPSNMTGNYNIALGQSSLQNITSGSNNTAIGFNSLELLTTQTDNIAIGYNSGSTVIATGTISIGSGSGSSADNSVSLGTTSSCTNTNSISIGVGATNASASSVLIGENATLSSGATAATCIGGQAAGTGSEGICIGNGSTCDSKSIAMGPGAAGGSANFNIAIGNNAGITFGGTGNNIAIGNTGSGAGDNISIGTTQTTCNIAGIYNTTPGVGYQIVVADNTNKLSTISAFTPTLAYTLVNTSPYVVQNTDDVLGVDTSVIPITIQLPDAPAIGRSWVVKDLEGTAVADNITVTTVSGVVLIDGFTTFVMNSNFESATLFFNGTSYMII